jgi:5-methyltetrahydrofolate corrinoid/iron sulfur protein methyltransferase
MLRGIMNRTYLIILRRYGLYSAIVDAFDKELFAIARGERPDIENLVHNVMDGETVELSRLSRDEMQYVKTTRVLMGQNLYSDSWLEL